MCAPGPLQQVLRWRPRPRGQSTHSSRGSRSSLVRSSQSLPLPRPRLVLRAALPCVRDRVPASRRRRRPRALMMASNRPARRRRCALRVSHMFLHLYGHVKRSKSQKSDCGDLWRGVLGYSCIFLLIEIKLEFLNLASSIRNYTYVHTCTKYSYTPYTFLTERYFLG